jgi:hypothetical protein
MRRPGSAEPHRCHVYRCSHDGSATQSRCGRQSNAIGALLAISTFGWPLILAGGLKITYDLLLLMLYRKKPLTEDT